MTNTYFEHTPTPVNSSTSPVENLAQETSKAFEKVDGTLKTNNPIPNYSSVIGNYLLLDINYHGIEDDFTETLTIPKTSSQINVQNIVKDSISISYLDPNTKVEKYLVQKLPSQSFTGTDQFKVLGRQVIFSGDISSNTVKIKYRGIRQQFGNLNLKPNVLFNSNKNYLVDLKQSNGTTYYVEYDNSIGTQVGKIFNSDIKDSTYLLIKEQDRFETLQYEDVYISDNRIYFNLTELLEDDYKAVVFINNVSVGEFLEAFYYEFINHSHSKDSLEDSISHNDLTDLYKNTNYLFYKDSNIINYQHPQFLNREGYNPEVTSAYENALLGDLLLSSKITEEDQEFKTLLKNSNSILFGDPLRGSKLFYDSSKKAIVLLTGNGLDGLNIVVSTDNKAISINNDSYIAEKEDSLIIKGKNNTVSIVSDTDSNQSTFKSDNLKINYKATLQVVSTNQIDIGNTSTTTDGNNVVMSKKDSNTDSTYTVQVPSNFTKLSTGTLNTKNLQLRDGDKISTDDNNSITKGTKGFDVSTDAFNIRSTTRGSGVHVGSSSDLESRIYTANYLGDKATQQDSDLYIEAPQQSDIYLIKNTDDTYSYGGNTYAFNSYKDNATSIKSLKQWKGANLHLNTVNAVDLILKPIDGISKNGLKIGSSRITVIGSGLDCPEGMTILESLNSFHFINPLPESTIKCGDLSYQDVNLGKLQIFGTGLVEKSFSITEGLQVGTTITTSNITASDTTTTEDLSVLGDSKFLGVVTNNGAVNINNKLTVTGETNLNGSLKSFDLTVNNFVNINGTLTVNNQSMFNNNVSINGTLTTQGGFTTNGKISSDSLDTGDINSSSIKATGTVSVDGTTTLTGPSTIKGSLSIVGNTNIDGTLETNSELTAKSLYVTNNASIDGRLIVNDDVTFTQTLVVGSRITTDIGLYTSGTVDTNILKSSNSYTQTLQVTSGANIDGGANITGKTTADGNVIINGSCNIGSTTTIEESLLVKGITVRDSVDISNILTVSGSAFLEGDIIQIGTKDSTTTITGNVQLSADRLTLTGSMMIYKDLNITGGLVVTGVSSFSGDVIGTNSTFSSSKVSGTLTAEVAEFNRRIRCNDGAKILGEVESDSVKTSSSSLGSAVANDFYAKTAFNMGAGSTAKMDSITANSFSQTDADQDSTFASNLVVNKDIKSKGALVLGDESIQYTSAAKGVYLSPGKLLLGDGSNVGADKFTAKPGMPSSDSNNTIGYTFNTLTNTGMYGSNLNTMVAKTNISFYVEGILTAFLTRDTIGTSYPTEYDKHLVNLGVLKTAMSELREQLTLNPYAIVDKCYPINSIYLTMDKRDPNTILGFGVWIRLAAGRTLIGKVEPSEIGGDILGALTPPSGMDLNTIGSIGGNYTHTLTKDELPNVQIELEGSRYISWLGNRNGISHMNIPNRDGNDDSRFLTRPLGNSTPITTVTPYIVVGMWRRIG